MNNSISYLKKQSNELNHIIENNLSLILLGINLFPIETHDRDLLIKGLIGGIKSVINRALDEEFINFLKQGFVRLIEIYIEYK